MEADAAGKVNAELIENLAAGAAYTVHAVAETIDSVGVFGPVVGAWAAAVAEWGTAQSHPHTRPHPRTQSGLGPWDCSRPPAPAVQPTRPLCRSPMRAPCACP